MQQRYERREHDRGRVAEVLSLILDRYTVLDMSVQDPPLDQVIARVFQEGHVNHELSPSNHA